MSRKLKLATAPVLAAALFLGACGDSGSGGASAEGSAATAATADVQAPTVEAGTPSLPVTFTDDAGNTVEVASLERVAVMDDPTLQIAHALGLGDAVKIVPTGSLFPELAEQAEETLPEGKGALNVEGMVALQPDLVIGSNLRRHEKLTTGLRDVGVPAVIVDRAQPAPDKIRKTAELLGVPETGEELAGKVEEQIAEAAKGYEGVAENERPRVMHLSSKGAGDSGTTTGAGESTPAHEIIVAAGGVNTGAEAGLERYSPVTAEGLIAVKPEYIVVAESELEDLGGEEGIWEKVAGLNGTPAAEKRNLIVLPDEYIKMSGVSAGAAVQTLQQALYADK
ncbi:heme/hemin ABC transporter substrate-binding protein [Corynebacterium sp. 335C]